MITLQINGTEYSGFTSVEVNRTMEALSGSFSFGATASGKIQFPARLGDECVVLVSGKPVITGFIEHIGPSYDSGQHSLEISGRDKTCDVIDSSFTGNSLFTGTASLATIIKNALKKAAIPGIKVIDNVGNLDLFKDSEVQAASVGESVFQFCDRYARKRQVLLMTDGLGNIIITRAGAKQCATGLFNVIGGDSNNIKAGSGTYDGTSLFSEYIIKSQSSLASLNLGGSTSEKDVVSQHGDATDATVRSSRRTELTPPSNMDAKDAKKYALWQRNLRRAKAFNATVIVHGHEQGNGDLWAPNLLVDVHDDFLLDGFTAKAGRFLIKAVKYRESVPDGSLTEISIVERSAFTEELKASTFENASGILSL